VTNSRHLNVSYPDKAARPRLPRPDWAGKRPRCPSDLSLASSEILHARFPQGPDRSHYRLLVRLRSRFQVVLAARRIDRLQALKEQIENEGGHTLAVPVDVANYADIHNMVQSVLDIYGHVDILFNNAGFGRLDWLEQLDPARDIETQIDVNLSGVIETTRAVLPHMIERRRGHIINMASVAGWIAAPTFTVYAATK
jgi:NAD(P)-dependent dehydrogenase (short-subunit alcohol dehydrogenase family)